MFTPPSSGRVRRMPAARALMVAAGVAAGIAIITPPDALGASPSGSSSGSHSGSGG